MEVLSSLALVMGMVTITAAACGSFTFEVNDQMIKCWCVQFCCCCVKEADVAPTNTVLSWTFLHHFKFSIHRV